LSRYDTISDELIGPAGSEITATGAGVLTTIPPVHALAATPLLPTLMVGMFGDVLPDSFSRTLPLPSGLNPQAVNWACGALYIRSRVRGNAIVCISCRFSSPSDVVNSPSSGSTSGGA